MKLFIGNKNYSSWSMRPWLALRWAGLEFTEEVIPLGAEGYGMGKIAAVVAVSPTGRVPVLHVDGTIIWDSMAICEWAAERAPLLWPADDAARAVARSVAAEMHGGFGAVRRDLSMNIRRRVDIPTLQADTREEIQRIVALWRELREIHGGAGPWLFGERSIADAFFAPVVTRFRTYRIPMEGLVADYAATLLADPDYLSWERDALAETWHIEQTDCLYSGVHPS